jgi:hypothetical protein
MSALQVAHSGGRRERADLPADVGSGGGACSRGWLTPFGPTQALRHAVSRHSITAAIRCFMAAPVEREDKDYACLAPAAYSSSLPRMQLR